MERRVVVGVIYAADGTFHVSACTHNASIMPVDESRVNGGGIPSNFFPSKTDKSPIKKFDDRGTKRRCWQKWIKMAQVLAAFISQE